MKMPRNTEALNYYARVCLPDGERPLKEWHEPVMARETVFEIDDVWYTARRGSRAEPPDRKQARDLRRHARTPRDRTSRPLHLPLDTQRPSSRVTRISLRWHEVHASWAPSRQLRGVLLREHEVAAAARARVALWPAQPIKEAEAHRADDEAMPVRRSRSPYVCSYTWTPWHV